MVPLILKPPRPIQIPAGWRSVFLAGSIEMGRALDWQSTLSDALSGLSELVILNPRRDEWDASWRQSIDEPRFREQVEWELEGLERAELIACFFAPETQSPITLLELGLHARSGKLVVCCPPGFWRRGNIEVVCARYRIERCETLEQLASIVQRRLADSSASNGLLKGEMP